MKKKISIRSYTFKAVIEEDKFPDGKRAYHAYVPELENLGGATWGYTQKDAIKNLQEVVTVVIESLLKKRQYSFARRGKISANPLITLTA